MPSKRAPSPATSTSSTGQQPRKKPKKLARQPVSDSDSDPAPPARTKTLAEQARRRLSGKHAPRPSNPSLTSLSNIESLHTPASKRSRNSSPTVGPSEGVHHGHARVGALARVRENQQARNANRSSNGAFQVGIGGSISTEVMNNNYDEWMKMATDNKINVNNTWSFALIDYFHDMSLLRNPESQGGINFQKASCTLDGCVKIWTSRVDSVATETGKLLSGLSEEANNLANNRNPEDYSDTENEETPQHERNKKPRTKTTTNNNGGTSNSLVDFNDKLKFKELELEFTVDPLFKKTCADFDEGGPGGILMSHLAIDSSMTIVFDASGKPIKNPEEEEEEDKNEEEEQPLVDVSKLKSTFLNDMTIFKEYTICPSLSNFKFSSSDSIQCFVDLAALAETNQDNAPDQDPIVGSGGGDFFDSGYSPTRGNAMDFEPDEDDDDQGGGEGLGSVTFNVGKMPNEKDLVMALIDDPNNSTANGIGGESSGMFDYFDKSLKKMWAGPEHWKLRRTVISKPRDEEGQSTMTRTRREKPAFSFDFTKPLSTSRKLIFQPSTITLTLPGYKPPKPKSHRKMIKKIAGSKTLAGNKQMLEQHCLPDDMHFNASQLLRFDMKPKATFNMRVKTGTGNGNGNNSNNMVNQVNPTGEIDENYWAQTAAAAAAQSTAADQDQNDDEDPNGPIPFATQFFQDEEENDDIPDFEEEFDNPVGILPSDKTKEKSTMVIEEEEEQDLLAATQNLNPNRINRPEFVSYAKKAKRVDVKKLKENIWRELEVLTKDLEDESTSAQVKERAVTEEEEGRIKPTKTFTKVIGGLRKMYPKEKMEEISTSFCFICLLHLANEKGLRIKSSIINGDGSSSSKRRKTQSLEEQDDDDDEAKFVGNLEGLKVIREEQDDDDQEVQG